MKEYDYGHTIGTQAGQWIKDNLGGKAKVAIISRIMWSLSLQGATEWRTL